MAYVPPTAVHVTARDRSHTVRDGDTVHDIASRYGVSAEAIVRANSLSQGGRWILPGSVLRIPGGSASGPVAAPAPSGAGTGSTLASGGSITVRAGDTLSHLAVRHGVSINALVSANNITNSRIIHPGQVLVLPGGSGGSSSAGTPAATPAPRSTGGGSYTVRAGDTLWSIAQRHGVSVSALSQASGLSSGQFIHPGQRLRMPGGTSGGGSTSGGGTGSSTGGTLTRPYDESTIGDYLAGEDVEDTFLHYRYSNGTARSAAANREHLAGQDVPSRSQLRQMIVDTATRHGVDPDLMVAVSYQESGWNHRAVSPANAIGAMQVIPTSGEWASSLVGRELNLLDPQDNVTAGVVIMRALLRSADSTDHAIGGYYQGLGSVRQHGLFSDTRQYVRNIRHFMQTL